MVLSDLDLTDIALSENSPRCTSGEGQAPPMLGLHREAFDLACKRASSYRAGL